MAEKMKLMACKGCGFDISRGCVCWECPTCHASVSLEDATPCSSCHSCNACCSCYSCGSCGLRRSGASHPRCDVCGYCSTGSNSCCRCATCPACSRRVAGNNRCSACHRCLSNCCNCDSSDGTELSSGVRHVNQRVPTFHAAKVIGSVRLQHRINPSLRFLSLELETAGANKRGTAINKVIRKWHSSVVHDGSLPANGFEINTAPASGDLFVQQMQEMSDAFKEQEAFVTSACGMHCHIDARDFRYADLRKLLMLHTTVEDALMGIVAPSRRNNHYCEASADRFKDILRPKATPADKLKGFKQAMFQMLYGRTDPRQGRTSKTAGHRYLALNLQSWMYRGTIENRMHHGSVTFSEMVGWGILMAGMLDYAMNHSEGNILELGKMSNVVDRLVLVAPTDENKAWVKDRWEFYHKPKAGVPAGMVELPDGRQIPAQDAAGRSWCNNCQNYHRA